MNPPTELIDDLRLLEAPEPFHLNYWPVLASLALFVLIGWIIRIRRMKNTAQMRADALAQAHALGAEKHLGGAGLTRIGAVVEQMAKQGLHDEVDEEWRDGDRLAAAEEGQVIRLQRAGGEQGVAEGDEHSPVVLRIGVGEGSDLAGGDRSGGRLHERRMQRDFGGARFGDEGQFGPCQKEPQVVVGGQKPAA